MATVSEHTPEILKKKDVPLKGQYEIPYKENGEVEHVLGDFWKKNTDNKVINAYRDLGYERLDAFLREKGIEPTSEECQRIDDILTDCFIVPRLMEDIGRFLDQIQEAAGDVLHKKLHEDEVLLRLIARQLHGNDRTIDAYERKRIKDYSADEKLSINSLARIFDRSPASIHKIVNE